MGAKGMDTVMIITLMLISSIVLNILIVIFSRKGFSEQKKEIKGQKVKYNKLLSQKKSSEVRLGRIGENLAPFVDEWPWNPNNFRFIGNPVDGINFDETGITFVEIKTGKARLTASQKLAKRLVKEGKVKFATFRIDEHGSHLKIEENDF